jgi:PAS domain S-box-containing protein
LADSQARSRAVFDQTSDGVYLAEAGSLRFLEANLAFCQLIGCVPDELQAHTVEDILAAPDDRADMQAVHRLDDATHRVAECQYRHRDGTAIDVEVSVSAITYDGQDVRCVVVRDIRQRKRTEQALRRAKERAEEMLRVKSALLDNISHELRTPLAGILGYASILREEVDASHRGFAETIVTNGRRLENTLNTILELAQLESGNVAFEVEEVVVSTVVADAIEAFSTAAHAKDVALEVEAGDPRLQACVDRSVLDQILRHVLDNAIKFTNNGAVTIRTAAAGGWVTIEVQDTGVGIGTQFLPRVFEEFKQESDGLTREHEHAGAGLGLTIACRLLEHMEGRIDVDSEKGKGTTVTIALPQHSPPQRVSAEMA